MTNSTSQPMDGSPVMEDPERLARRLIQRAWNHDGLPEIAVGLISLYVSGIFVLQLLFEKRWQVFRGIPVALVLLVPSGYLIRWAVRWIRARYLVKREGYVEMRPRSTRQRMLAVSVGSLATIIMPIAIVEAFRGSFSPQWVLAVTGVFGGLLFPICGRAWRFVFFGAAFASTGVLLGVYDFGLEAGWAILYGVSGALTLISGVAVLLRFFRQTRETGD